MREKPVRTAEQFDRLHKYTVSRFNRGEPKTFSIVFNHFNPQLVRYAKAHGFDYGHSSPEDFASSSWLKVLSSLDKYQPMPEIPFAAWFWRVAKNNIIDTMRREEIIPTVVLTDTIPDKLSPTEATIVGSVDLRDAFFYRLSVPEKQVLWLQYIAGYPVSEIAAGLGKNEITVRSRSFRARQKLERNLA